MRKLILQMQMSVDGQVSADADIDWQVWNFGDRWTWDERLKTHFNAIFETVDCILLSRKMVEEGYLDHWERMARDHADDPRFAFARRIGQVDKVVLTDKLQASRWKNTVLARGGLLEEVSALKRRRGGDIIVFGGVGFASALVAAGVVDEYQLFVNPTAVGAGRSIFGSLPGGLRLQLQQSTSYDCGIVVNRYSPAPAPMPRAD
jgi:dihydrofolate reductase